MVGTGIELHTPRDITEMAVFSGMPTEQKNRTVVIAPRMNKTLQSGGATNHLWQITWKNQERWSNPLMGWTSTADPMSNLKLTFDSQDEANNTLNDAYNLFPSDFDNRLITVTDVYVTEKRVANK